MPCLSSHTRTPWPPTPRAQRPPHWYCLLVPQGLGRTLFERLQALYGRQASSMLTVQYRMNAAIMQWASDELYQVRRGLQFLWTFLAA